MTNTPTVSLVSCSRAPAATRDDRPGRASSYPQPQPAAGRGAEVLLLEELLGGIIAISWVCM